MASEQVKFIADVDYPNSENYYFRTFYNNNSTDGSSVAPNLNYFIGKYLNTDNESNYVNMTLGSNSNYIGLVNRFTIVPKRIRIIIDREYTNRNNTYLAIYYNDILIGEESIASFISNNRSSLEFIKELSTDEFNSITKTKTKNFNNTEPNIIDYDDYNYDFVRINTNSFFSAGTIKIWNLQVFFENDDNTYYSTSNSIATPTITSFYPVSCSGRRLSSSSGVFNEYKDYVNTPYNSSSFDNKYIKTEDPSFSFFSSTDNFQIYTNFNISGNSTIDKCFLNIRYKHNTSGENRTNEISILGTTPDNNNVLLWGGGQKISPSTSGFLISSSELYFQDNKLPSLKYANLTNLSGLNLKFSGIPSGVQISSIQLDVYTEPENTINFFTNSDKGVSNNNLNLITNGYLSSFNDLNFVENGEDNFSTNIFFNTIGVNPTGSHTINFYTSAGYHQKAVDLYVRNQDRDQSVDLYIKGHESINDSINFQQIGDSFKSFDIYMNAKDNINSLINFYTNNANSNVSGFDMFTVNVEKSNDKLIFYTNGLTPELLNESVNFYENSSTNSSVYNNVNLVLASNFDPLNSIPFYIGLDKDQELDSINFYSQGGRDLEKQFNMFLHNNISGISYYLRFLINANQFNSNDSINFKI